MALQTGDSKYHDVLPHTGNKELYGFAVAIDRPEGGGKVSDVTGRDGFAVNYFLDSGILKLGQEKVMLDSKGFVDEQETCGTTVH